MAVSLETREPLLDHKLLEYVATVPSSLKLHGTTRKYLLKRLLERRLPASILHPGKAGLLRDRRSGWPARWPPWASSCYSTAGWPDGACSATRR